jgi:hypothetical protein
MKELRTKFILMKMLKEMKTSDKSGPLASAILDIAAEE